MRGRDTWDRWDTCFTDVDNHLGFPPLPVSRYPAPQQQGRAGRQTTMAQSTSVHPRHAWYSFVLCRVAVSPSRYVHMGSRLGISPGLLDARDDRHGISGTYQPRTLDG